MPLLSAAIFLSATIPSMPPAPIGDEYPLFKQTTTAIITEASDYGGTKSTMKAKVTPESAKSWCENWYPGKKNCVSDALESSANHVYEATANCETGDLWTDGKHYLFDGPETKNQNFQGYVGVKDAATGKRLGMSDADRGREFGSLWLTLCPMGWPYKTVPADQTFKLGPNDEKYGEHIGHNKSVMFNHQRQHIIVYAEPKQSLAGTVTEDTVLVRGWEVPNEWFSGIAYTYKKGCAPAPYLVSGHYQGGNLTLLGRAPVREGCNVVGYSDKGPNARLVFDLSE
ncbi:hypothetical protein MOV61_03835 [Neorhizobium sp. BETTINA12A]|uniref:hypothetical protein n=1 Tax=Neorhizobium sp. BETTINA12A TaxID=2908924 RepID=UPI001FF2BF7A|nr:hypothetical protein [Neorhizobium sp. BETTINA12A]MCJ9749845.1 hypothetical protein [Neorhizobium sp. BETTINA12A]